MTLTATADDNLFIYNELRLARSSYGWASTTGVILNDPCVIALEGG